MRILHSFRVFTLMPLHMCRMADPCTEVAMRCAADNGFQCTSKANVSSVTRTRVSRTSTPIVCLFVCLFACLFARLMCCMRVSSGAGWTSVRMRPLMTIFEHAFRLFPADQMAPSCPKIVPLSRGIADELVLCAALAPLATSDLAAPWDPPFCGEARTEKATRKLLSRAQACLKKADLLFEERLENDALGKGAPFTSRAASPDSFSPPCPRPVGFHFHFQQVRGVSGYIPDMLAARGWSVGPLLDLALSPRYDLSSEVVLLLLLICWKPASWILFCCPLPARLAPRLRDRLCALSAIRMGRSCSLGLRE